MVLLAAQIPPIMAQGSFADLALPPTPQIRLPFGSDSSPGRRSCCRSIGLLALVAVAADCRHGAVLQNKQ